MSKTKKQMPKNGTHEAYTELIDTNKAKSIKKPFKMFSNINESTAGIDDKSYLRSKD